MGCFRMKRLEARRPKDHKKLRSILIPAAMAATGDLTQNVSKRRIALLLSQTAHFLRFLRLSRLLCPMESTAFLREHKRNFQSGPVTADHLFGVHVRTPPHSHAFAQSRSVNAWLWGGVRTCTPKR